MPRSRRTRSFSIGRKITTAFAVLLLAFLALGGFAIQRMRVINQAAAVIADDYLPSAVLTGKMASLRQQFRLAQARYLMSTGFGEMKAVQVDLSRVLDAYASARQSYEPLINPGEARQIFTRIDAETAAYARLHDQLVSLIKQDDNDAASTLFKGEMDQAASRIADLFDRDNAYNNMTGRQAARRAAAAYRIGEGMTSGALALMLVVCVAAGFGLIRSISVPITALAGAMRKLAQRDLAVEIPGIHRGDEIGVMAGSVETFKESMIKADELAAREERSKAEAAGERQAAMRSLADDFETRVGRLVGMVASSSTELEATARSMTTSAGQTNQQATNMVAAAGQASAGVQSVAATAEELSSSIGEISSQVAPSPVPSART